MVRYTRQVGELCQGRKKALSLMFRYMGRSTAHLFFYTIGEGIRSDGMSSGTGEAESMANK
ncbi:MAG: hypothetical protein PVH79_04975 [Candidatus Bathyarchaeota archaeon]